MTTTISWVDYDEAAQRDARRILDEFAEKSAVDELGLGVVRDALAEALYPGTSTLHRRPRYLLFIAWTYRDLARGSLSGAAAVKRGSDDEHRVRRALMRHYGERGGEQAGIIGLRAGESLKRLPSAVYWAAIRRYEIRQTGSGSVDAYCHQLAGRTSGRRRQSLFRGDDDPAEDPAQVWAQLPDPDPDRYDDVSFDLTPSEARFLQERLIRSEDRLRTPEEQSLLAHLAVREQWADDIDPAQLAEDESLPSRTLEVLRWGRMFDLSVHGARLLYNLCCAERRELRDLEDGYRAKLDQWQDEARAAGLLTSWPANEFWDWVGRWRHSSTTRVEGFHRAWMRCLDDADLAVADHRGARDLIADREISLKRSLARLAPGGSRRLDQYEGDAGIRRYDYNWSIARRVLDDVHVALGHQGA